MHPSIPTVLIAVLLALGLHGPAAAGDRCTSLGRELAQLGGSGSPKASKYAASADRQRAALARAEANAAAAGCGGILFGRSGCTELRSTIARMRDNLASLEAMAGRGGSSRKARAQEIRTQMREAGCGGTREASTPAREKPAAVTAAAVVPKPDAPRSTRTIDYSLFASRGSYRTLCVRLCDGYYFPISWSTRPSGFATDDFMCQQQCPGTETRLFAHPTGTESDAAMSVIGEAYPALPAAYRYRKERVPGCGCAGMGTPAGSPLRELDLPPLEMRPAGVKPEVTFQEISFETPRFPAALDLGGPAPVRSVLPAPHLVR